MTEHRAKKLAEEQAVGAREWSDKVIASLRTIGRLYREGRLTTGRGRAEELAEALGGLGERP
jgi:hypothetical protein